MGGKIRQGKMGNVKRSHLAEDRPGCLSGPCPVSSAFLFANGSSSRCGETTSRRWLDLTHTIEELQAGKQKNNCAGSLKLARPALFAGPPRCATAPPSPSPKARASAR